MPITAKTTFLRELLQQRLGRVIADAIGYRSQEHLLGLRALAQIIGQNGGELIPCEGSSWKQEYSLAQQGGRLLCLSSMFSQHRGKLGAPLIVLREAADSLPTYKLGVAYPSACTSASRINDQAKM